jgi:hypothetical protein
MRDPVCSACGRTREDDDRFRVEYFVQLGLVLCQSPAYRRGESDDPGCKDKIEDAAKDWAESQGQLEIGEFL